MLTASQIPSRLPISLAQLEAGIILLKKLKF